jgi:hypothetical protein
MQNSEKSTFLLLPALSPSCLFSVYSNLMWSRAKTSGCWATRPAAPLPCTKASLPCPAGRCPLEKCAALPPDTQRLAHLSSPSPLVRWPAWHGPRFLDQRSRCSQHGFWIGLSASLTRSHEQRRVERKENAYRTLLASFAGQRPQALSGGPAQFSRVLFPFFFCFL